jgi:hypothetical protein
MSTNDKILAPDPAILPGSKVSILLYVVAKPTQKFSRFNSKTARYYVLK